MSSESHWFEAAGGLLDTLRQTGLRCAAAIDIPGYAELREHARGGQGVVYTAQQRATGRRVAIKVLYDNALDQAVRRRRFEREIELLARLRHPYVVPVYDGGVVAGRPYLVMEYVEGLPLDAAFGLQPTAAESSGPTPLWAGLNGPPALDRGVVLDDVLACFVKVCAAVDAAHQSGIIHRDLKPANIVVDGVGDPRILDFGIASPLDPGLGLTRAGQFLGTLDYAAPEQLSGCPGTADTRTDVYALGVILYELLTGRRPSDSAGSMAAAVEEVTRGSPPPPSRRGERFLIPADLDAIVMTALAKDPAQRYGTAHELLRDIERHRSGEPLEARRHERGYVLRAALRRYRRAVAITVTLVLAGFGVATGATVLLQRSRSENRKLRHVIAFLEDTLYAVERPPGGEPLSVNTLLLASEPWIEPALGDEPEVELEVRTILANSLRSLGEFERAEMHLIHAEDLARTVDASGAGPAAVRVTSSLGLLRQAQGRLAEAELLLARTVDLRRAALGADHPDVATAMGNLALCLEQAGRLDEAAAWLYEQLDMRRATYGTAHPAVALTTFNLARVVIAGGDLDEGLALHRAALDQREATLAAGHPDRTNSILAVADLLVRRGAGDEACDLLNRARTGLDVLVVARQPIDEAAVRWGCEPAPE